MKKQIMLAAGLVLGQLLVGQTPLPIPDTLVGTDFDLELHHALHTFFPGFETETYAYNGTYLGPTLLLKKGQQARIHLKNALDDTTTTHWHGLHLPAEMDGGPHTTIPPGETWHPQFEVKNRAGLYWYHPHLHEMTGKQVEKGAAGMIILRDDEEAALPLPRRYGLDDVPICVQSKPFNVSKQIPVNSRQDSFVLANGALKAYWNAPAQVVRLRLLNGSVERTFNFGLDGGLSFFQISTDGGLLAKPVSGTRLRLSPGERAEILVNFSGKTGQTFHLKSYASELPNNISGAASVGMGMMQLEGYAGNPLNGKDFNILTINVVAPTASPVTTIPATLADPGTLDPAQATANRTITFQPEQMMQMVNGPFVFNGKAFDLDVINLKIPLGSTEVWTLSNQTMIAHPFHIHDVEFRLLERDGGPVPASEQGWKDVVLVMPMSTVKFITRFEDFAGPVPFMYH